MKDDRGLYYYPFPANKRVRMYVRPAAGGIEYRMWNQDDPQMWEQHGWVAHEAIEMAKKMYKAGPFDPNQAYNLDLARALVADEG